MDQATFTIATWKLIINKSKNKLRIIIIILAPVDSTTFMHWQRSIQGPNTLNFDDNYDVYYNNTYTNYWKILNNITLLHLKFNLRAV